MDATLGVRDAYSGGLERFWVVVHVLTLLHSVWAVQATKGEAVLGMLREGRLPLLSFSPLPLGTGANGLLSLQRNQESTDC